MSKHIFTLLIVFLLFVSANLKSNPSCESAPGRNDELEECRKALREGIEETKKNRKLLKKCLKLLKEWNSISWKGSSGSKIALLCKIGVAVCLYQDYREPSINYKIAALICLWLM